MSAQVSCKSRKPSSVSKHWLTSACRRIEIKSFAPAIIETSGAAANTTSCRTENEDGKLSYTSPSHSRLLLQKEAWGKMDEEKCVHCHLDDKLLIVPLCRLPLLFGEKSGIDRQRKESIRSHSCCSRSCSRPTSSMHCLG